METPKYPEQEVERLDTLKALHLLDTDPEERFDRLTRLAKRLFGVPIALVSLVDFNRQWFKSSQGLSAQETPREISFCGHTILGNDVLVVPDTLLDKRFYNNPLVVNDPHIRFYAGVPLQVPNGSKLGTLCLIDRDPRAMSQEDLELLRDLGHMAERELAAVQLATLDDLTLISNRRGLMALGSHTLNLCTRLEKKAILLLFDLNSFKAINDRYGHAEGDRALVAFAQILRDTFRESDVIARLGGDEFVVLLSQVDVADIELIFKRLTQACDDHNLQMARGYQLSYSVGLAEFDWERSQSIDDLLQIADQQMYVNKKSRCS